MLPSGLYDRALGSEESSASAIVLAVMACVLLLILVSSSTDKWMQCDGSLRQLFRWIKLHLLQGGLFSSDQRSSNMVIGRLDLMADMQS